MIGTLSLSRIQYGNLCSGVLGYRIGGERQGEGFGTEAAKEGTRIGFEELSLHRMEADVMTEIGRLYGFWRNADTKKRDISGNISGSMVSGRIIFIWLPYVLEKEQKSRFFCCKSK